MRRIRTTALAAALALGAGLVVAGAPAMAADPLTGAIYTTDSICSGVDLNIYDAKEDVYLNGGPQNPNANSGLPDGLYYVQVTSPDGIVLGSSALGSTPAEQTPIEVVGGEFVDCYQLMDIVFSAIAGYPTKGFDDTTNPGGVYKVEVSRDADFASKKSDNFKVQPMAGTGTIVVDKFYDANGNGQRDGGEVLLDGWKVNISNGIDIDRFTPVAATVTPGDYTVTEYLPVEPGWMGTTPNPVAVTVVPDGTAEVLFGNFCAAEYVGKTIGFWSNKNGLVQLEKLNALEFLVSLNLKTNAGTDFDPGTYAAFQRWLTSSSATNMANMLSAQMSATWLNVLNGWVPGDAVVYGTGTTVQALLEQANGLLAAYPDTTMAGPERAAQEYLKNIFDAINNGVATLISPTPCAYTFAEA